MTTKFIIKKSFKVSFTEQRRSCVMKNATRMSLRHKTDIILFCMNFLTSCMQYFIVLILSFPSHSLPLKFNRGTKEHKKKEMVRRRDRTCNMNELMMITFSLTFLQCWCNPSIFIVCFYKRPKCVLCCSTIKFFINF